MSGFESSVQNVILLSYPSLQGSGILVEEEAGSQKYGWLKIFPETIGRCTYDLIAVWTVAVCTGLTQAQFRQNLSKEERKLAQNSTHSQEAFTNASCRKMKNQFSPVEWQWIYQPYPQGRPQYRNGLSTQTGLPVFQRVFFFSFLFFHFVP